MIEMKELAPQTLELVVRDKISKLDVQALEQALAPYLADEGAVNAVIDLRRMTGVTLQGFFADMGLEARLFTQIEKFGRLALVTESAAAAGVIRAFDAVMPQGSFKAFEGDALDAARVFVGAGAGGSAR